MSLDGRAVDEELRRGAAGTRECLEEVHPNALRGPADIPVVEGFARSIDARRVNPAGARLQHMYDAADHPPIIDARLTSRVGRQVRCDPLELPIRQPEMVATHRRPSSAPVNHETTDTQT